VFAETGERHGVSPQQAVLAWELALSDALIAIPGARRPASITDSAAAADLVLSDDEVAACSRAVGLEVD
jgi:aryl-alcohol dehydrogenase-like predicted oxidoreductase